MRYGNIKEIIRNEATQQDRNEKNKVISKKCDGGRIHHLGQSLLHQGLAC